MPRRLEEEKSIHMLVPIKPIPMSPEEAEMCGRIPAELEKFAWRSDFEEIYEDYLENLRRQSEKMQPTDPVSTEPTVRGDGAKVDGEGSVSTEVNPDSLKTQDAPSENSPDRLGQIRLDDPGPAETTDCADDTAENSADNVSQIAGPDPLSTQDTLPENDADSFAKPLPMDSAPTVAVARGNVTKENSESNVAPDGGADSPQAPASLSKNGADPLRNPRLMDSVPMEAADNAGGSEYNTVGNIPTGMHPDSRGTQRGPSKNYTQLDASLSGPPKRNRGKFAKGKSGNPTGRPRGSRNKTTLLKDYLAEQEGEQLVRLVVDLALKGDKQALNLCFGRLVPRCTERSIELDLGPTGDLPQVNAATSKILDAVGDGSITPSEGEKLINILKFKYEGVFGYCLHR